MFYLICSSDNAACVDVFAVCSCTSSVMHDEVLLYHSVLLHNLQENAAIEAFAEFSHVLTKQRGYECMISDIQVSGVSNLP